MINFLLFLTIVVGGPAHSEPLIVGERGVVSRNAVACRSLDDVEKIWTLTRKDKAAGEQYTADLMATEKCIIIYRGLGGREIVVDDVSVLHNAACVRVPDAPICWWVTREVVVRPARASAWERAALK